MSTFVYWFQDNKHLLLFLFIISLTASLSFGFGYLMANQTNPAPIIIEKCSENN